MGGPLLTHLLHGGATAPVLLWEDVFGEEATQSLFEVTAVHVDPLFDLISQEWTDHGEDGSEEYGLIDQMDPSHLQRKRVREHRGHHLCQGGVDL